MIQRRGIIAGSTLLVVALAAVSWKLTSTQHLNSGAVLGDAAVGMKQPVIAAQPVLDVDAIKPYARSAVVIDAESGTLLVAKNEHLSVPIASTTKIVSSIVLLRSGKDLDAEVTISKTAANQIGSVMGLVTGDTLTLRDLLTGALLVSGNDAIYAIAENDGGIETFVKQMNETAAELGMKDSQFFDPAGLNDQGHSSAFDISTAFRYALTLDEFRRTINLTDTTVTSSKGNAYHLSNSNRLIKSDEALYLPDAIGGKTGYTPDAGHTLVTAAERDGHVLITAVLHTDEETAQASAREARRLLSWTFDHTNWNK